MLSFSLKSPPNSRCKSLVFSFLSLSGFNIQFFPVSEMCATHTFNTGHGSCSRGLKQLWGVHKSPSVTTLDYIPFLADESSNVTDDVCRMASGNLSWGLSLPRNKTTYGLQLFSQFRLILDRENCGFPSFLVRKGNIYQQTFSPPRFPDPRAVLVNEFSLC